MNNFKGIFFLMNNFHFQNYGPWFDIQGAGIFSVVLGDHKSSKKDLSSAKWIYQVPGFNTVNSFLFVLPCNSPPERF